MTESYTVIGLHSLLIVANYVIVKSFQQLKIVIIKA